MTASTDIRSLTRRQLLYYLEEGLKGDELLMKEVWEQCETAADKAAAKHELGEMIEHLRCREQSAWRQGLPRDEITARMVETFTTYPQHLLLDELVECTVRYHLGDLEGEERRIATALLDRLSALGFARKEHREGCEIWPERRLCRCPWIVPS
jgi:hypothetical protein